MTHETNDGFVHGRSKVFTYSWRRPSENDGIGLKGRPRGRMNQEYSFGRCSRGDGSRDGKSLSEIVPHVFEVLFRYGRGPAVIGPFGVGVFGIIVALLVLVLYGVEKGEDQAVTGPVETEIEDEVLVVFDVEGRIQWLVLVFRTATENSPDLG